MTSWETEMRNLALNFGAKPRGFQEARWRDAFNSGPADQEDGHSVPQTLFDMPLQERTVTWTSWHKKQGIWDRLSTLSFIASLNVERQEVISFSLRMGRWLTDKTGCQEKAFRHSREARCRDRSRWKDSRAWEHLLCLDVQSFERPLTCVIIKSPHL